MSTWCCEDSETPRVRNLFRSKQATAAPPATETAADTAPEHPQDWPSLLAAVLEALLPFNDALQAARQVIRTARDRLPQTT